MKHVQERCSTDFTDDGRPLVSRGTVQDITERVQAEQALADSERRFRTLFDSAADAFFVFPLFGPDGRWGRFVEVNRAAVAQFGYSRDELLAMTTNDLNLPGTYDDIEVVRAIQNRLLDERKLFLERILITRDGHRMHAEVSAHVFDLAGVAHVLAIVRDVSERKRAEARLLEANRELVVARDIADHANRAKSEFLANMSHEIRTPMNAIVGLTRLVLDSPLLPQQQDQLRKVLASSHGLLAILNDVLDYAKIEAGRMAIERIPLRVEEVLRSVADLFSARLEEKGLQLYFDIAPEVPAEVLGDPLRLAQVLNNLVGNAIKFTERGEICVSAAAEPADDGIRLRFAVSDTGIGLDPAVADKLFEPFTQADGSVTRKYGGTGLGLSICQRLVALMDGTIGASGRPGHGATFGFEIGVGRAATDAPRFDSLQIKGLRVLVVDDQASSRRILRGYLESWAIEVAEADTAAVALQTIAAADAEHRSFDVLLLDSRMPGIAGLAAARRIVPDRARSERPAPMLLLMSAPHDTDARAATVGAFDFDGMLAKPVVPSHLFNLLARRAADPATPPAPEERGRGARFTGAAILLVEDNALNQEVAATFLERRGARVCLASDGAEALERVVEQKFDAVLMDLHMPGMDGIEATKRIRDLPSVADLPIIAMTAAVLPEDRARCAAAGMVDFVAKPVDPDELCHCLQRWLPAHLCGAAPEQAVEVDVPALPGFDLAAAVRSLDGDTVRLGRLLRTFARERAAAVSDVDALLAAGEERAASELLHALAGTAANLGAVALADRARRLMGQIGAGRAAVARDEFAAACAAALAAIAAHFPEAAAPGLALSEAEIDRLGRVLAALRPYVHGGELAPDPEMRTLRELARRDAPPHLVSRLVDKLDRFDHEGALVEIARIAATYALDLSR